MLAVDRVLAAAVDEGRVPGVVGAVGSVSETIFAGAYGLAASDSGEPMRADAIFRIASMTKLVTSIALMILVDEGRLDLEAPLARYLPGFRQPEVLVHFDAGTGRYRTRPAAREATIRELLSHTGGYGYWFLHEPLRIASGPDPDLFDPPFLIADPGTRFAYSTSTDVVGQLVLPVSGQTLDAFFDTRIFAPLGMDDSGFRLPRDSTRLTRMHRRSGRGYRELPLETADHPVRGGGGLYSTAGDYLRLLRCLLGGGELDGIRVLSAAAVDEICRNQIGDLEAGMQRTAFRDRSNDFVFMDGSQKFGFGVMIETADHLQGRAKGSCGWAGIANTYFWFDRARSLAAVLMLQIAPFASPACIRLLQAFESAAYADFRAGS